MNLGVFLAIGESFSDFARKGQDRLIIDQNLRAYARTFSNVYVFSYGDERFSPYKNVFVLPNKWHLQRYLYSLMLPFLYRREILSCGVLRGLQITGGIPGMLTRFLYKKPIVVNYGYDYAQVAKTDRKIFQYILYTLFEPIILASVNAIIVTTEVLKQKLSTQLHRKVYVIPNGVDIDCFKPRKQGAIKRNRIIFIGRLERVKNLDNLIIAVSHLPKKVELRLVGSGSLKDQLQDLARQLGVDLSIIETVPHDQLPFELRKASVFVLPSLSEGHPKALLEAMACGLPVVGSDVPGIRELIKDRETGLLCRTEVKSMVSALDFMLHYREEALLMGKRAKAYVVEHFNLRKTMGKEIRVLKEIAQ